MPDPPPKPIAYVSDERYVALPDVVLEFEGDYETNTGGEVFSVGSIAWPSAILVDDHVARITANVLNKFLS